MGVGFGAGGAGGGSGLTYGAGLVTALASVPLIYTRCTASFQAEPMTVARGVATELNVATLAIKRIYRKW